MTDRITGIAPISRIPRTAVREALFALNRIRRNNRDTIIQPPSEAAEEIVAAVAGPIQRAALHDAIGSRALNAERFCLYAFTTGATMTLIDDAMGWETSVTFGHVNAAAWLALGATYLWLRRRNRNAARDTLTAADGMLWETRDRWEPGERTAVLNLLQDNNSVDIMSSEDDTTALVDGVQRIIGERDALRAEIEHVITSMGADNYRTGGTE